MTGNGPYDPYRQQPPPAGQGYPPQHGGAHGDQQYGGQYGHGQSVPPPPSQGGQGGPPAPQGANGGRGDQGYGPLSLPDETSIYVYGAPPEDYSSNRPGATPPNRSRQQPQHYPEPPRYSGPPPRALHWKEALAGLVLRPLRTMDDVRDQALWWPALLMSALGGILAILANDSSRQELFDSTVSTSVPAVLMVAVAVPAFCALLGVVSHALATQFGGNGSPAPFVTLSMIVVWIADAPRLAVALFAPDDNPIVTGIGIASFVLMAWLLTALMMRVHELPWPRALGCVAVELVALLLVLKLPLTS